MRVKFLHLIFTVSCLSIYISAFSQGNTEISKPGDTLIDSLRNIEVVFDIKHDKPEIVLSADQAVRFLNEILHTEYWNDPEDPLRAALGHLIFEASHPPLDSSAIMLKNYPYDSLNIPWDKFYIWEHLRFKIPFLLPPGFKIPVDSVVNADTNVVAPVSDSISLEILKMPDSFDSEGPTAGLKDTTIMVITDTLTKATLSNASFPFRYLNYPFQGDSMQVAVRSLLNYLEARDSAIINFTGVNHKVIPVWMNTKARTMIRFWLKNEFTDSVAIWIGNPSRDTISLYLEQGVSFRRPVKKSNYSDATINIQPLDNSKLLDMQKIIVKPHYWIYRSEAAFVLNQSSLTNWVKGGESSISIATDITGYADYNNKNMKLSSNNFIRLNLGFIASDEKGVRKNVDLLETNSKLNHKAFGKFDFSGVLLFKTQVAPGYSYIKVNSRDTSILVSKFMNPAILTIGFGLDYKPNKETSLNFSPLSYKGTFVLDTLNIDQTKYGIDKDRKSKNEPGVSFMISNIYKPFKNLTITNRLQLFTNYIHNPQNVDIDWEMIVLASLNWFTDLRLNTHLIFDDDTKTPVLKDGVAVKRPDGTEKKTARAQFKEMLGFSFVFRF